MAVMAVAEEVVPAEIKGRLEAFIPRALPRTDECGQSPTASLSEVSEAIQKTGYGRISS